jgi:hypothetical protein
MLVCGLALFGLNFTVIFSQECNRNINDRFYIT